MLPLVGAVIVAPHLQAYLQDLFEPLIAFRKGREEQPKPSRFVLVPGCTDPEPGAPAGQDVQRRDDLCQ